MDKTQLQEAAKILSNEFIKYLENYQDIDLNDNNAITNLLKDTEVVIEKIQTRVPLYNHNYITASIFNKIKQDNKHLLEIFTILLKHSSLQLGNKEFIKKLLFKINGIEVKEDLLKLFDIEIEDEDLSEDLNEYINGIEKPHQMEVLTWIKILIKSGDWDNLYPELIKFPKEERYKKLFQFINEHAGKEIPPFDISNDTINYNAGLPGELDAMYISDKNVIYGADATASIGHKIEQNQFLRHKITMSQIVKHYELNNDGKRDIKLFIEIVKQIRLKRDNPKKRGNAFEKFQINYEEENLEQYFNDMSNADSNGHYTVYQNSSQDVAGVGDLKDLIIYAGYYETFRSFDLPNVDNGHISLSDNSITDFLASIEFQFISNRKQLITNPERNKKLFNRYDELIHNYFSDNPNEEDSNKLLLAINRKEHKIAFLEYIKYSLKRVGGKIHFIETSKQMNKLRNLFNGNTSNNDFRTLLDSIQDGVRQTIPKNKKEGLKR